MAPFELSFREYLEDFLLISTGVFVGSVLTDAALILLGRDLPGFLGLSRLVPAVGPGVISLLVWHLLAVLVVTIPPALGVLGVLYLDYLTRR